ncbi:hypothetical protein ACNJYD_08465 [Bradyrhizobium sp. DASA03005]|uniref:hypothetical protein n=1 Tax=Bradyrhizobium sp. SPXBL-02 TaxID=3395912 RepID=UPI003F70F82F
MLAQFSMLGIAATISGISFTSSQVLADDAPPVCVAEQAALGSVASEYKPRLDSISKKGDDLKKDVDDKHDVNFEMKVEMKEQKWIFDLPSVTMRDQRIIYSLPEFRMNTREFSFDVPETVMVPKKIGQYPEFKCSGLSCTVKWSDIITNVPEVRMSRRSFKMDIPETKMADQQIIMGIPEFKMDRQTWFVKLPEFILTKIEIGKVPVYSDYEKRGKELEGEANALKAEMKGTLITRTNGLFSCLRADLAQKRGLAVAQTKSAVDQLDGTMKAFRAQGGDPATVKVTVDGKEVTLAQQYDQMVRNLAAVGQRFDTAASKLNEDEKAAIAQISSN